MSQAHGVEDLHRPWWVVLPVERLLAKSLRRLAGLRTLMDENKRPGADIGNMRNGARCRVDTSVFWCGCGVGARMSREGS